MNVATLIHEALGNLISNKVRSLLTMLGIFIGVGAVIAMMSIGLGARNTISSQMSDLGTNTLYLYAGNFSQNVRNGQSLTMADATAISELADVDAVAPVISTRATVSVVGETSVTVSITGIVPAYAAIENYKVAEGKFITQENLDASDMVVVIGSEIRTKLFPDTKVSPIGQSVRIQGQPYTVTGVLESKGNAMVGSQNQTVFVPLTTVQNRLATASRNTMSQIGIEVREGATSTAVQSEITTLMRDRHGIAEGNPDDFTVYNMADAVNTMNSVMTTFVVFLGGVASISLLVGGIGIMNIMLVTVSERTKEIGLRKALGAKNKDILVQFLVESSVLSLVGGVMGIIFGLILSALIATIATTAGTTIKAEINPLIILGATLFSTLVGLFFGIYPANRASKLEPVIALRTE